MLAILRLKCRLADVFRWVTKLGGLCRRVGGRSDLGYLPSKKPTSLGPSFYLGLKVRSPASPKPGIMYPEGSSPSSTAAQ